MDEVRRACQHWAQGEPEQALVLGERALERASACADPVLRATAHLVLGHAYHALGLFPAALDEVRAVLDQARAFPRQVTTVPVPVPPSPHQVPGAGEQVPSPPDHEESGPAEIERAVSARGFPGRSLSVACALGAQCLSELGDHAGALDLVERAERAEDGAGHGVCRITLAAARGQAYLRRGAVDQAIAALQPALRPAREQRLLGPLAHVLTILGDALTRADRPGAGVEAVREAIQIHETSGVLVHRSYRYVVLAAAHARDRRPEEAGQAATEAVRLAERHAERAWEAWGRYTLGEITRSAKDFRRAEQHYDEAQEIAEELAMRPLLERCRAGLRALR